MSFLNTIEAQINSHDLLIDFEGVSVITVEAVLALIATMKKHSSREVRGTVPVLPEALEILRESGFFQHVQHKVDIHADAHGKIARFEGTTVDPVQARELILHGTGSLTGYRVDDEPAYCVILEAMQNTVDHAHAKPPGLKDEFTLKTETWWAMVYSDHKRKRICFALLDTGVGIFRSAKIRAWRRADRLVRKSADVSILKRMLQGGIESRTGLDYRGKGLPRMNQYSAAGEISDFLIVSNSVHAKVGTSEFFAMNTDFRGTLLYWEIIK